MNVWETTILKAYQANNGSASNREIYDLIKQFIALSPEHLRPTVYGGRPAYVHQVRSHITNLSQSGDLRQLGRGLYELTLKGRRGLVP
jgi:restriction endonuclease Mrr